MDIFECMHAYKEMTVLCVRVLLVCMCKNMWVCMYVSEPMNSCALCSARVSNLFIL
jgi:hypothetical protein